jgi:hypothetical protein
MGMCTDEHRTTTRRYPDIGYYGNGGMWENPDDLVLCTNIQPKVRLEPVTKWLLIL